MRAVITAGTRFETERSKSTSDITAKRFCHDSRRAVIERHAFKLVAEKHATSHAGVR